MTDPEVSAFLESLTIDVKKVVASLRRLVREVVPQAEESVAWGALSYHRPELGGRVKGAVCQIVVRRGLVRLDFIHGVRLSDPSGLLRGFGVSKRYVPVHSLTDTASGDLRSLIQEAANFDSTK